MRKYFVLLIQSLANNPLQYNCLTKLVVSRALQNMKFSKGLLGKLPQTLKSATLPTQLWVGCNIQAYLNGLPIMLAPVGQTPDNKPPPLLTQEVRYSHILQQTSQYSAYQAFKPEKPNQGPKHRQGKIFHLLCGVLQMTR